jgi:hypothetical protein
VRLPCRNGVTKRRIAFLKSFSLSDPRAKPVPNNFEGR